jgi:uncharacterized membrane protein YgdD (TMEM256/DUF423 family)
MDIEIRFRGRLRRHILSLYAKKLQLEIMYWSGIGALLLGLAVVLGAFGAHGLRGRLDAYSMGIYEKAVFYQIVHALGILIVPLFTRAGVLTESGMVWICGLLLTGTLIFSGSLYLLALTGVRTFGAITPIGGLAFIAAWFLLAFRLLRR